ncbi:GNAT family N-acetyltransferase [Yokenella regensburgei]|uniref:GNAT family N-acetyltransferase n=1 Tax=Yokenella regensburgei TaxID=158877 RepID=UPI003F140B1A
MTTPASLQSLTADEITSCINELSLVLENCVQGGASVSFMLPFDRATSIAFWQNVALSVSRGERVVLVERDGQGIVGTVQLILDQPENQPHRADVAKLLVHERARRQGIAGRLMAALETAARDEGKTVLVLDTTTGSGAEIFYSRAGWQKVGEIPRYALMPDGEMASTSIFYKFL